jgi:hypothetical protein
MMYGAGSTQRTGSQLGLIAVAVCVALIVTSPVSATGLANARAIGMAGAYTSLAKGYYSPAFNPANLGFASKQMNGIGIFGAGVSVSNNTLSLDDYNTYTGATLNDHDKEVLLGKIPSEGLRASVDAEASAVAVGMRNLVFSFSAIGAAEVNLNRDVVELLLQGNTFADTVMLDGTYGEGYGLASFNLSYGQCLYKYNDRQLAVGTTVRFLKGLGYEEITEANGHAVTLATGFSGAGSLVSRTAEGGMGYACDLGAALQISKSYTVGVSFFNLASSMTWNHKTKEHRYWFTLDTLTLADLSEDSIIVSSDTSVTIGSFSSSLPRTFKVGLARTAGSLLWAVDWEQGFKRGAGCSSEPRVSAGAEYRLLNCLPMRAGFGLGGKQGTTYAAGLGVEFLVVHLDFAAANYNAVSGYAGKGLNLAISGGVRF